MKHALTTCCVFLMLSQSVIARDFEGAYAVYGAGADNCRAYLDSMKVGGRKQDYFIDYTIGYLTAFNVIMPKTYNVLGESEFDEAQGWLQRHCNRYPRELYINAVIKLTEALYPMRYQSGLKKSEMIKPVVKPKPSLKGVSKSVK